MRVSSPVAIQSHRFGTAEQASSKWLAVALVLLAGWVAVARSEESDFAANASAEDILDALLEIPAAQPKAPLWQAELGVRLAGGHTENVLYSPFAEQDSLFSASEAELYVFRQTESKHHLSLYAFGSHRHYFDLDEDNDEYAAVAQGGWEYRDASLGTYGLRGTYYYFDQFFDASISDVELDATRLRQHDAGARSYIRYSVFPRVTAEVGGGYKIASLEDSDDDYGQRETSTALEGRTHSGLAFALGYRYRLDDYDERVKRTAEGEVFPGDSTDLANHEARLYGSWFWDAAHNWKTRWRLTTRWRDDDGGGYYDYVNWHGGIGMAGRIGKWGVDFSVDYTDTDYDKRPSDVFDDLSSPLHRQRWDLWLRLERELSKRWRLFTEVSWEDNDANDPLDVYGHSSVVGGIGYTLTRGDS